MTPARTRRSRRHTAPRRRGARPGVALYRQTFAKRQPKPIAQRSDTDVLGGLLGSPSLAAKVLSHGDGTLNGLNAVRLDDLALSIPGLGFATAARVACLMEASRRIGGTA